MLEVDVLEDDAIFDLWSEGPKYFKQEPIQRRFDFSDVLYFGWPNQPSSGTMRVYIELLLCTYIYIYIYSKWMLT